MDKTTFTKRLLQIYFLLLVFLSFSCKGGNSSQDEIIDQSFSAYAKDLTVYSGDRRMMLTFRASSQTIDHFKVSWDNNSKVIPVEDTKGSILQTIIDGLEEKEYSFEILAYNRDNKPSAYAIETKVRVYGDRYRASLENRKIASQTFIYSKDPILEWTNATDGELFLEINYTGKGGELKKYRIPETSNLATLPDFKEGSSIAYRSLYLPVKACIDTFITTQVVITEPPYYSSLSIKNVVEKSGLVKDIVYQLAVSIDKDVEYSSLQFKKGNGEPLSIFVLEANLANDGISIHTLMPNNATEFGRQTIKGMAEHRDTKDQKVLAAINADFFDYSPVAGLPWGPVVIDGNIVKTTQKLAGTTYFGITKKGKPQIGYYSANIDLSGFKEVVGGGSHWLVVDRNNGAWGGDTKEPRTSVGYTSDNVVYLVVVDGRNATYSVGVELTDLALIMKSLGTLQAINLDGGGSSTMVIRENDVLGIVNRYSDSAPRAVANGLVVMKK